MISLPKKFFVIAIALTAAVSLFDLRVFLSTRQQQLKAPGPSPKSFVYRPKVTFGELLTGKQPPPRVLGTETDRIEGAKIPIKESYVVVAIGDSMIETMGDSLDYFNTELRSKYPATGFAFYNYGIGSENIEEALARFDKPFDWGNRHYSSVPELHPDIVVLGSWAYNPLFPYDRDKYWTDLSEVIKKAKGTGAKVYVLSEIAPLSVGFGKGPGGVNWPDEIVAPHVGHIIQGLEDAVALAKNMGVGVIDAFDGSKTYGNFGRSDLISSHDGIHPSILGEKFMASLISSAINLY